MRRNNLHFPDEDLFENLLVIPSDVDPQQTRGWECFKRAETSFATKMPSNGENALMEQLVNVNVTKACANSSSQEEFHDCTVLTFVFAAMTVRDLSQPMPPPSRFVRNRKQ